MFGFETERAWWTIDIYIIIPQNNKKLNGDKYLNKKRCIDNIQKCVKHHNGTR